MSSSLIGVAAVTMLAATSAHAAPESAPDVEHPAENFVYFYPKCGWDAGQTHLECVVVPGSAALPTETAGGPLRLMCAFLPDQMYQIDCGLAPAEAVANPAD